MFLFSKSCFIVACILIVGPFYKVRVCLFLIFLLLNHYWLSSFYLDLVIKSRNKWFYHIYSIWYVYNNKFSIKSNELDSSVTSVWTAVEINNSPDSPNCLCMCFDMKHIQKLKIRSKLSFRVCSVIRKCPPQRISWAVMYWLKCLYPWLLTQFRFVCVVSLTWINELPAKNNGG